MHDIIQNPSQTGCGLHNDFTVQHSVAAIVLPPFLDFYFLTAYDHNPLLLDTALEL
jgi:hypothetical protein